jgi:hypothetical protein
MGGFRKLNRTLIPPIIECVIFMAYQLAIVLIICGGLLPPALPQYGRIDLEQSAFLQYHLPIGSKVLSGAPANIWAARMTYYGINSYDIPLFEDAETFLEWVQVQHIRVIDVDEHFPAFYEQLVSNLVDNGLEEVFASSNRVIRVYFVDED